MARKLFASLLLLAIWSNLALAVDQTREDRASGFDVVEATIELIHNSHAFTDDSSFLLRVAYAETHFGTDPGTFNTTRYRGMWRLSEASYNKTKDISLGAKHAAIQATFNINWDSTTWDQLNTPLYGGLAARLFLETLPQPISQTKAEQAKYWIDFYTQLDRTEEYFLNETQKLEDEFPPCEGKMDIVVVLDGSGSVTAPEFEKAKAFVANLLDTFSNDTDFVRKAFIVFSAVPTTIFNLTSGLNATQMRNTVENAMYPDQGTNTNEAILSAVHLFQNAPDRSAVPRVMTLFTDGQSQGGVSNIELARQAGITPFAVGIGSQLSAQELLQIALNDTSRVYNVSNFDSLSEFFRRLNDDTCKVPQQPGYESTPDTLGKNQKRFYKYSVPEEGLTVVLETSSGNTRGYYSYSYTKPSAALHDGRLSSVTYIPRRTTVLEADGTAVDEEDFVYLSITGTEESNEYVIQALPGVQVPTTLPPGGSTPPQECNCNCNCLMVISDNSISCQAQSIPLQQYK